MRSKTFLRNPNFCGLYSTTSLSNKVMQYTFSVFQSRSHTVPKRRILFCVSQFTSYRQSMNALISSTDYQWLACTCIIRLILPSQSNEYYRMLINNNCAVSLAKCLNSMATVPGTFATLFVIVPLKAKRERRIRAYEGTSHKISYWVRFHAYFRKTKYFRLYDLWPIIWTDLN